ncbi:diacylglycerol kinase catalytic region [Xylanimonas cellulosilytica DSM 15894]|uniref:Diacylglycerol kinase catalytic region n=1 Tax=Xylanimonas cellulosilytica (strain DSM 15894 / JCM 12276 / CECT 5975 / KCTC 9989 / LMG 20990 / NBRC 107835 / XIL07) TaxID=446471 RepID=D1C0M6_XYLCX|nr:diacylglycerol kinase family protein [Xylanimonas cellulosilytica]ACZ32229.1 diacylglycerol kinase catalytic region [Xylanimonas cellulosilytica DSM 15894]
MTRVAVVVNPTKFDDVDAARRTITEVCARHGVDDPLWIETTEDDPGSGQTREALAQGADVVCAFGGDGTVRAVGEVLAGGDVPLGLLPGGTGNLLARALDLPVDDAAEAMDVVLGGREERIDVGVLRADGEDERVFLVMAGMGLDAEMMDRTDDRLKAAVGWVAYAVGGLRAVLEGGFGVHLQLAGGPVVRRRVRAVVVGNSGRLQGGLALMPEARLDDGLLDVAVVAPRGVVGWVRALATLVTAGRGHRSLDRSQAPAVRMRADAPTQTQLDGDPVGAYRELEVRVRPGALRVKVAGTGGV